MEFEIRRSNRRTMALEITREEQVLVRAPFRMPLQEIQQFVEAHTGWIESHLAKVRARHAAHPQPTGEELAALTRLAAEQLPAKVAHYGSLMNLQPAGITITTAATRFGSCSPKNRLCFSCRLMGYPPQAIDYVVVHELAHIVHKNHGKAFYALIESILPDYKARIRMLKG